MNRSGIHRTGSTSSRRLGRVEEDDETVKNLERGIRCGNDIRLDTRAVESGREVTWAGDVAAIFQEKCQECHRPNSIAPMPLWPEEAKLFAPVIRYRVENRVMPPWHVNPQVGIQGLPTTGA